MDLRRYLCRLLVLAATLNVGCRSVDCCRQSACPSGAVCCPGDGACGEGCGCGQGGRDVRARLAGLHAKKQPRPALPAPPPQAPLPKFHPVPVKPVFE